LSVDITISPRLRILLAAIVVAIDLISLRGMITHQANGRLAGVETEAPLLCCHASAIAHWLPDRRCR